MNYISANNVLAVVLVGGEGSRLGPLTLYRTKPAIMAGPSILASFSSSAALNCGIDKVILASQYLPFSLEKFYSQAYGSEFGHYKKIDVIGPHHTSAEQTRYKGTADAFYKALQIGVKHQCEYVLGLSGDHIYSFNFEKLFSIFPQDYGDNSFVVFTKKVERKEAHRFGILEIDEESGKVKRFVEKPKDSELAPGRDNFEASMGIYFAPLRLWHRILEIDQKRGAEGTSSFDIGGNVIPYMINEGRFDVKVFSFDGFWADVGEPKSLYDTYRSIFLDRNPDIFGERDKPIGSIGDPNFYKSNGLNYFTSGMLFVKDSWINGSIFSPGVDVNRSEVLDSIIMGQSQQNYLSIVNSTVKNAIIDKMCNIADAKLVSDNGLIVVARGTMVARNVKIHVSGNAVVASFPELVNKVERLKKFIDATDAEIYDNFGTRYSYEELLEKKSSFY